MSDKPANINLKLALDQAALQQSTAGVDKLKQELADIKSKAQASGSSVDGALKGIVGDASSATQQVKELNSALEATSKTAEKVKSGGFGVEGLRRTGGALTQLGLGDIGQPIQRLGDLGQVVKEVGTASEATGIALGPIAVALGGIALAVGVFQNVLDNASKGLSDAVTKTDAYYKAIETGTTESLKAELASLQVHQKIEEQKQKDLQAAYIAAHPGDVPDDPNARHDFFSDLSKVFTGAASDLSKGGKELNKDLEDTTAEINKTKLQIDALKEALKSDTVAANDDAKAHEELHKTIGEFADTGAKAAQKELDELNKAVQTAQKAAQDRANKEVAAVEKYNDAVLSAEESAGQARVDAATKLNDALVAAAEKAVEDANNALQKLEQKRADNLTSLTRDEEKADREAADKVYEAQVNAQRQERDDLQQHLQRLKDIRDQDAGRERDDLLNRNYRDLFALKEQKKEAITQENDKYAAQEQQRKQALGDELNDQRRQQEVARRERFIAYQQANADALKAYNIELANAQAAKAKAIQLAQQGYQKELDVIYKSETKKLDALQKAAVAELKIINQTEQEKQKIFQRSLDQARQMLGQMPVGQTGAFNSPQNVAAATAFAEGGPISAYQAAFVNEPGSSGQESFNGVAFPRSMGLFIPKQSGTINPGKGGGNSITISMPINGVTDPVAVGRIAEQNVRRVLNEVLR